MSRDWLDGFWFPAERRFGLPNSAEGHEQLIAAIREMPGAVKIGFEATGGRNGALGHTRRGRDRGDATAPGTDQGLCPFAGHAQAAATGSPQSSAAPLIG